MLTGLLFVSAATSLIASVFSTMFSTSLGVSVFFFPFFDFGANALSPAFVFSIRGI
jgi:hypothetical protein